MKKSRISLLLVIMALVAMMALVACGGGATTETPEVQEPVATEAPA